MVELRRANQDTVGPDGRPLIGRGYEVVDDRGSPLRREQLRPGMHAEIAVAPVVAGSSEERQAMRNPAFGVDRAVQFHPDDGRIAVLDRSGQLRAGFLDVDDAGAAARLLDDRERTAWVFWEWLAEDGRAGVEVAMSRPELAPRRLGPPARPSASAGLAGRPAWLIAAALVIVALAVFASCG